MDIKVQFFPTSIDYKVENDRVVVYIIGRTLGNKKICILDYTYFPHFYVSAENLDEMEQRLKSIRIKEKDRLFFAVSTAVENKKYLGKDIRVLKVNVNSPKTGRIFSDLLISENYKVFGHDIGFLKQYLAENNITFLSLYEVSGEEITARIKSDIILRKKDLRRVSGEMQKPRILAIDIERLYKTYEKNNPITMISFLGENFNKVISYAEFEHPDLIRVQSEAELLVKFKEIIDDYAPDLIAGYNSDFLLNQIKKRAKKYDLKLDVGLDYSPIKSILKKGYTKIFGIAHIDLRNLTNTFLTQILESEEYDLEYISYQLLGEKRGFRKDINSTELISILKDKERLGEYADDNLADAKLISELSNSAVIIFFEFSKLSDLDLFSVSRMGLQMIAESVIIKKSQEFGELIVPKQNFDEIGKRKLNFVEKHQFVKTEQGVYNNISYIDIKNIYPNIILEHNISYETLNCDCCRHKKSEIEYWMCDQKKGILPEILKGVLTEISLIKEQGFDEKYEETNKIRLLILNNIASYFYRYLSLPKARYYCIECAKLINSYFQKYIASAMEAAKNKGIDILYADSSLLFISSEDKFAIKEFITELNSAFPEGFDVFQKGFYKKALFAEGKEKGVITKYALIDDNNKLLFSGFEVTKKNVPEIARTIQKEIIRKILADEDISSSVEYLKTSITKIRENIIGLNKMILSVKLQKSLKRYEHVTPYVAAARLMQNKELRVHRGINVNYIIAKGEGKISDRVKLPEDSTNEDYDPEYYINNQIIPAVEPLFKIFNITKEQLLEEKEQSTLDQYFKS